MPKILEYPMKVPKTLGYLMKVPRVSYESA